MSQQGVDAGLAAAEGAEAVHRRAAATGFEDLAAKALADLGVEQPLFLESCECIGREYLGPLVAVVPGRVTTGKDVREGVLEAVERRRRVDGHLGPNLVDHCLHPARRVGLGVQAHVDQRELDLAQRLQPALEVARRQHAVEQRARQRLAGVDMGGQARQHLPFPAEVFHELAGQFDRVPLDAGDAGHRQFFDLGQHVVQAVAEFVEQRDHVVVGQQRRFVADRRREVADQMRHRRLQRGAVGALPAAAHHVHPRTRALAGAGVGIEVELADQLRCAITRGLAGGGPLDAVEAHAVVPHRRGVEPDAHIEQGLDDVKQAVEHPRFGEVLLHRLFAEGVARFLQLLGHEVLVPGLQIGQAELLGRESAQLDQVALRMRARPLRQVAQKGRHLGR